MITRIGLLDCYAESFFYYFKISNPVFPLQSENEKLEDALVAAQIWKCFCIIFSFPVVALIHFIENVLQFGIIAGGRVILVIISVLFALELKQKTLHLENAQA